MIPYIVALLTAGLTFLFFDYAIGHRARRVVPLAFRRLNRKTEFIGWWHMGINFVIAIYYAAIVAWALRYMVSLSRMSGAITRRRSSRASS